MLEQLQAENQQLKRDLEQERSVNRKEQALILILAGKSYPNNNLPIDINILTAKALVNQVMAQQGIIVTFDEGGKPTLKQSKDGALIDVFIDNKKVDFPSYVEQVLVDKKFVSVKEQQKQEQLAPSDNIPDTIIGNRPASSVFANASIVQESRARLQQLGIESSNQ